MKRILFLLLNLSIFAIQAEDGFLTKEIEKVIINFEQYKSEIIVDVTNESNMIMTYAEIRCFSSDVGGRFSNVQLIAKGDALFEIKPTKKKQVRLMSVSGKIATSCGIFNVKMRTRKFYDF